MIVASRGEVALFVRAVALIGLRVVDDAFLQPQPGTSAGDHVLSGLVPLAILGVAVWAYPPVSPWQPRSWSGPGRDPFTPDGIGKQLVVFSQ